jgi:hypothetical protein
LQKELHVHIKTQSQCHLDRHLLIYNVEDLIIPEVALTRHLLVFVTLVLKSTEMGALILPNVQVGIVFEQQMFAKVLKYTISVFLAHLIIVLLDTIVLKVLMAQEREKQCDPYMLHVIQQQRVLAALFAPH